jgi:glucose/arabinose dehydrogenase
MMHRCVIQHAHTMTCRQCVADVLVRAWTSARSLLFFMTLICAADVYASAGGRSGFSGNPTTNGGAPCSVCHAPDGAASPVVEVFGPTTVNAGTTQDFTVRITGGPAQTAGVGISSRNGVGELLPSNADLYQLDGELTHTAPKNFSANQVTFAFRYKAPNYDTVVNLHVAGNSTNGGLDLVRDGVATIARSITVTNGFEPPPNPPPPAVGELTATLFATGFNEPVAIENAGDDRLFVVERSGIIRIVEPSGAVLPTPFLSITQRVDDTSSEMGLLGLAFHPNYKNNGYFYVYYTRDPGTTLDRSRVARYTVSSDPNVAIRSSEQVLLEFEQPFSNHNGGDLHFDSQGYLHIASGDGGSGGDPQNRGQSTTTLLGKMLRIDVNTPPGSGTGPDCNIASGANYSIPPGNAFNNGTGGAGCDEIFALGLRNPWRFSFDRATGAMWIADVGQNVYEEINYLPPGSSGGINLGWRCFEGAEPYNTSGCNRVYLPPVHTYSHATSGCSVTGGRVYRGERSPHLRGQYFFSDFCQSSIRALSGPPGTLSHRIVLPSGVLSAVSTFGEDYKGELYVAGLNSGNIHRLTSVLPPGC